MSGLAERVTDCRPLLRRRRPPTVSAKLLTVAVAFALAVVVDILTGGRWRWISGGAAVLTSVLVFLPGLSWLVKPVSTYTGVWLVFNLLRAWADDTAWADRVLGVVPRLEAWLFAGRLPSAVLQERFAAPPGFAWYDYALTVVYLSFFVVPHLVAVLLLWRSRRLFWRFLLASGALFALALVGFFLIPTAPPWLVAETLPTAGLAEIRRLTEETLGTLDLPFRLYNHAQGEGARVSEVRFEPNPIAAMPSIHFASTALLVFPACRRSRILGLAVLLYAALMGVALVYLGEHYVLDLAVGGLLAALGWAVAGRCLAIGVEDAASPIGRAGSP